MTGLVVFAAIVIAEVALSWTWNRFYFTFGLPIFSRRIDGRREIDDALLDEVKRKSATAAAAPFAFRRMGPDAIAFRESGGGLMHYTPIMRGLIRHDPSEPGVKVLGYMNWFVIAAAIILTVVLRRGIKDVWPYFVGWLVLMYFVQFVRFNRLAGHLRVPEALPQPRP